MLCRICGAPTEGDNPFCNRCGKGRKVVCPSCNAPATPDAKFCSKCGASLHAESDRTGRSGISEPRIAPGAAEHIFESAKPLSDELKNVTVLFADITNSTGLIEGLSPEAATRLLQPTLKLLSEKVHSNGGIVAKVQGDGVLGLFGAPVAMEDHALRACRAATEMQSAVLESGQNDLRIHVGMDSGVVLLRTIDTGLFKEYDPTGWTVHLASRMSEMAEPGEIRITGNTANQVLDFATLRELDATRIRGTQSEVRSFVLEGLLERDSRWEARRARGLNIFVGRRKESIALKNVMTGVKEWRGGLVALAGAAGIGKSRLIYEFQHLPDTADATVLYAASRPDGAEMAYLPIQSLLKAWIGLDEDRAARRKSALNAALAALDPEIFRYASALKSLLDIPIEDAEWDRADPFERRRAIRQSMCALMRKLSARKPLIIIVEDLHWIDAESQDVLHELALLARDCSILLLVSHRPEYRWPWPDGVRTIELTGLETESARQLLDDMLGMHPSLAALKQMVIERAAGTPLFLEEMVRTLMDTGKIRGTRGEYRLSGQAEDFDLPQSVTAIIAARVELQSPPCKKLLELASVIGSAPEDLLATAMGLPNEEVRKDLLLLEEAKLLDGGREGEPFVFTHDIAREVTYSLLLEDRRRELHGLVAGAIESQVGDQLDEKVDQLALHCLSGELWDKAAQYYFKASIRALARSANRQVVSLTGSGLEALTNLSESPKRLHLAIDLRLVANTALISIGDLAAIVANLDEAASLAGRSGDERRLASVNTHLAIARWLQGEHETGSQAATEALQVATQIDHVPLIMGASSALSMSRHAVGEFSQAIRLYEGLRAQLSGKGKYVRAGWTVYPLVLVNTFLASSYIELGDYRQAKERINEGLSFADEMQHPYSQATILDYRGYYHLSRGHPEAAIPALKRALELCDRFEILNLHRSVSAKLALAEVRLGETRKAIDRLQAAIDTREYLNGGTYVWHWLFYASAVAHLAADAPDRALTEVQKSMDLTARAGERPHLAQGLKLKGDILVSLGRGQAEEALQCYAAALDYAKSCGMRPLEAHCLRALGEMLAGQGQAEEAQGKLKEAHDIFGDLGLTVYREAVSVRLEQPPVVARPP